MRGGRGHGGGGWRGLRLAHGVTGGGLSRVVTLVLLLLLWLWLLLLRRLGHSRVRLNHAGSTGARGHSWHLLPRSRHVTRPRSSLLSSHARHPGSMLLL